MLKLSSMLDGDEWDDVDGRADGDNDDDDDNNDDDGDEDDSVIITFTILSFFTKLSTALSVLSVSVLHADWKDQ